MFGDLRPVVGYGTPYFVTGWQHHVNAAGLWTGFVFQAPADGVLDGFVFGFAFDRAGVQTDIGLAEVFAAPSGFPSGPPLAGVAFTPLHNAFMVIGLPPVAVTHGAAYAILVRNQDPAPATNWFSVNTEGGAVNTGSLRISSVNAGAMWIKEDHGLPCAPWYPRYQGVGVYGEAIARPTGDMRGSVLDLFNVAGTRVARFGQRYRFPAPFRVFSYRTSWRLMGTPTFAVRAQITSGGVVLAESANSQPVHVSGHHHSFFFPGGVVVPANADVECVLTPVDATAGDAANHVRPGIARSMWGFPVGSVWTAGVASTAVTPMYTVLTVGNAISGFVMGRFEPTAAGPTARRLDFSGGFTL